VHSAVQQRWCWGGRGGDAVTVRMTNEALTAYGWLAEILALNKRFGQRMDGDFPGTIEKLCLELPDVEKFRPIHQLDFATSGVLLIGMSQVAAAQARKSFDSGRVKKCYLAILEVEAGIRCRTWASALSMALFSERERERETFITKLGEGRKR
jgi:23S rRNA-/tRNA-specific pseudouridylate synthase